MSTAVCERELAYLRNLMVAVVKPVRRDHIPSARAYLADTNAHYRR